MLTRRLVLSALLAAAAAEGVGPEDARGRVKATVTDATGATLPGARVLLIDLQTLHAGPAFTVGVDGRFEFAHLKSGDYDVIVAGPLDAPCFVPEVRKVETVKEGSLQLGISLRLDLKRCGKAVE